MKAFEDCLVSRRPTKKALQEKHQGQIDILQKNRDWTAHDRGIVIFSDKALIRKFRTPGKMIMNSTPYSHQKVCEPTKKAKCI